MIYYAYNEIVGNLGEMWSMGLFVIGVGHRKEIYES